MNRITRNSIALAIAPHTGHGRTRRDYSEILNIVRSFGFIVTDKVSDEYTPDMSSKHNSYKLEDMRTEQEIDCLLVIDEYFGLPKTETKWVIGLGFVKVECRIDTYEINAYVS